MSFVYVILSGILSRASRIEVSVVQLLGSSEPAQRVFAIQVRIIILSDIIPYTL